MDYYGYTPLLTLDRPLAVCGIPGAAVGRTVRAMNLLSGLPFVWVDRQVEHRLGRSVELVQLEEGAAPRLVHERALVDEALKARVPPMIALSEVSYTDPGLVARVEAEMDVVLLHVDVPSAVERVLSDAERDVRKHWALRGGRPWPDRDDLTAALQAAASRYRHLSRVVLVRDRLPIEVAEDLLADLGLPASPGNTVVQDG